MGNPKWFKTTERGNSFSLKPYTQSKGKSKFAVFTINANGVKQEFDLWNDKVDIAKLKKLRDALNRFIKWMEK